MSSSLFGIFFLYFCGAAGCFAFGRLRLPLPALLGSLTAAAALAIAGLFPPPPADRIVDMISTLCKIAIGVMMGRRIGRDSLRMIGRTFGPALLISVWMIALSAASGMMLARLADIPLSTALIGCTTGGVSEMAIFALSKDYDVATITVIQSFRLVGVLAMIPWLARKWAARLGAKGQLAGNYWDTPEENEAGEGVQSFSKPGLVLLIALSAAGGMLFQYLEIPAGAMLGALVLSGGMRVVRNKAYPFPGIITSAAQIGIGIAIAQQFGPEQAAILLNIRFLLSVVLSIGFVIIGTLLLGCLLQKMTRWSPLTCLLATSAGGLTQIVLVAEEMKADSLTIGVLHLARYLAIVSCMPLLIACLLP